MVGRVAPPITSRRVAATLCLAAALTLGWFSYGHYMLAVLSYSVPQLNLNWNAVTLPPLTLSNGVQPATLIIDKLRIQAPIVRDVPIDNQAVYDNKLMQGVALASNTAPLEAATGNSFIFGHSSRFAFKASPYDTVFALLPRLSQGDIIKIASAGQTATYKVSVSKSIATNDMQYLGASPERELTLVTCWPAGTNFRRWVVQAVRES